MGLNDLEVADREQAGPLDLLVAVEELIDRHTPTLREHGWAQEWVCNGCEARLSDAEARTHIAHKLWEAGYLQAP